MSKIARIFAALALVAVAGCAEATAEVTTPTVEADPRLVRAAERVLAAAADPEPGWHTGVVVTEGTSPHTDLFGGKWEDLGLGVLTTDGMVFLSGGYCHGDDHSVEQDTDEVLSVLLSPGDLITWTAEGHEVVCSSDLRVLRKAAAGIDPEETP